MRRGFKAEAERRAQDVRGELGLSQLDPLCPWEYASHLGVVVLDFDLLDLDARHRKQLTNTDPESWSGVTLKEAGRFFVLLNPSDTRPRQVSTLMHEVAHIVLRHVPGRVDVSKSGLMLLSDYPEEQEQEADWLAATLLLPREALEHYRRLGWTPEMICERYGVSGQLCAWRLRMTGVEAQLGRGRRAG